MLAIDRKQLVADRECFDRKIKEWKHACDMVGQVCDETMVKQVDAVSYRALLTCVEAELLSIAQENSADADSTRKRVQVAIRQLRAGGLREKDALPTALYKWAYMALTST